MGHKCWNLAVSVDVSPIKNDELHVVQHYG